MRHQEPACDTVLVANRGEIALRVLRTAHAMGLRTVAIFTAADRDAPHVRAADDAAEVSSYLAIDEIAEAAHHRGAQLVHPGYGFLSERAAFAREIEGTEPLVLVGPSSGVMEAMGKKDAARDIAVAAGVPVVPSYDLDADPAGFAYPVLVKAAAGGGGKGMRIVRSADDFAAAVAAAKREALSAFGDDTILIEKYVEHGRHIEVQVLADHHGNVVHLFERDCSTQRRHQKVLEEAPAPTITDAQRELVTSSAVALCREVGYTNAGTVEFLLDSDSGEVYFLEMNTRLQVEHPVTEEVVRVRGSGSTWSSSSCSWPPGSRSASPRTTSPSRATRSRRGSTPRTPSAGSCPRPAPPSWSAGPPPPSPPRRPASGRAPGSASTPPSSPARSSPPASTRCSAR